MLKLKKIEVDMFTPIMVTVVFLIAGVLILCLLGVYGYDSGTDIEPIHNEPIRECLFIGLPVLFSIIAYVWSSILIENPIKRKYFDKNGFVWGKCPYIVWIIKCLLECLVIIPVYIFLSIIYLIVSLKYTSLFFYNILMFFYKVLSTIKVIFTIPDGKAEAKIKEIWG